MAQILGFEGGVFAWPRKGARLFSGSLPDELAPGGSYPMYITSIQVTDFDVTGKVICLNDKRILYEFGKGFGTIAIQGEVLIGNMGVETSLGKVRGQHNGSYEALINWFNEKRVSNDPTPLTVSAGSATADTGGTFKFYLSSFQLGPIAAETGVTQFQLVGDLIEMAR